MLDDFFLKLKDWERLPDYMFSQNNHQMDNSYYRNDPIFLNSIIGYREYNKDEVMLMFENEKFKKVWFHCSKNYYQKLRKNYEIYFNKVNRRVR